MKRVGWNAFEFTVERPHQVRVTNASYGFEKEDHTTTPWASRSVTASLCPLNAGARPSTQRAADYKHKVALATVGSTVVLQTAVDCPTPSVDGEGTDSTKLAERLRADRGVITEEQRDDASASSKPTQVSEQRGVSFWVGR